MSSSNRMNRIYLANILRPAKGDTSVVSLNMLILQLYYRMKPSAPISFIQIIISKEYICTSHMVLYAKMYTIFVVRYLLPNYTNICIYIHSIYLPCMPSTSIIESPDTMNH